MFAVENRTIPGRWSFCASSCEAGKNQSMKVFLFYVLTAHHRHSRHSSNTLTGELRRLLARVRPAARRLGRAGSSPCVPLRSSRERWALRHRGSRGCPRHPGWGTLTLSTRSRYLSTMRAIHNQYDTHVYKRVVYCMIFTHLRET